MSLVISKKYSSINYDPVEISVEFVVLHYTASSLCGALKLFQNPQSKASCHLLIDTDGCAYELVPCLEGQCFKAWHAGDSQWVEPPTPLTKTPPLPQSSCWKGFNQFSIGIELVNKNGNYLPYTSAQYDALSLLVKKLQIHYPALKNPHRVVGHEHIANHRGKIDPGFLFDWSRFFKTSFPNCKAPIPNRPPTLTLQQKKQFLPQMMHLLQSGGGSDKQWMLLNTLMEQSMLMEQSISHAKKHISH